MKDKDDNNKVAKKVSLTLVAANVAFSSVIISLCASIATTPVATYNYIRRFGLPNTGISGTGASSILTHVAFYRAVWKAMPTGIVIGQQKGAVANTSKSAAQEQQKINEMEDLEEHHLFGNLAVKFGTGTVKAVITNPYAHSGFFSQLDILLTSYHVNKSFLDKKFTNLWDVFPKTRENVRTVFSAGYPFKTALGFVNFFAIGHGIKLAECLVPEYLCDDNNRMTKNIVSGSIAGAVVSVISYPISYLHDTLLHSAKIEEVDVKNTKGQKTPSLVSANVEKIKKLNIPSTISFFNDMKNSTMQMGLSQATKNFLVEAGKVLPSRMFQTVVLYAVINVVSQGLGETPLSDLIDKSNEMQNNNKR